MNKKIIQILLLIFLAINIGFSVDCPYGLVNEPYPGTCFRYVDQDSNSICDLSQEENIEIDSDEHSDLITGQELKTKTVKEIAIIYNINEHDYAHALSDFYKTKIEPWDKFQTLQDNIGLEPSIAKDIAIKLSSNQEITPQIENISQKNEIKYPIVSVTIITILLYFITFSLYKAEKISLRTHRKIWNIILLISFLISAILGLLLVIRINYNIQFNWFFNLLYWHVEFGIIMAIISIFHIIWHIPYFKILFKK